MAHTAAIGASRPSQTTVDLLERWLASGQSTAYELQNSLLEVLDAAEDSSNLALEALRIVAEATSAGWTQADVHAAVKEVLLSGGPPGSTPPR
ncbi:hypothetical protein [Candidatus Poriferisodalis sp.]|uniref:hypothetical protein n=1 Tax=Candidatus Poriferisodalis sp. TaxID=3101277 RepID=UPI003B013586